MQLLLLDNDCMQLICDRMRPCDRLSFQCVCKEVRPFVLKYNRSYVLCMRERMAEIKREEADCPFYLLHAVRHGYRWRC